MNIITDVHDICNSHFLHKADKNDLLVSTVYNSADSFANKMEELEVANVDSFMNSLYFDDKGNLGKTKVEENSNTMLLNFPYKQVRRQSQDDRLKNQFTDLKNRIIKNIVENVRDQCDEST